MPDRPSARRFILTMLACAGAVIALAVTGAGGVPLLAAVAVLTLGTVEACFRNFDTRHRASTVSTAGRTHPGTA